MTSLNFTFQGILRYVWRNQANIFPKRHHLSSFILGHGLKVRKVYRPWRTCLIIYLDEPAQDPSWMDYNGSARATLAPQSAATLTFLGKYGLYNYTFVQILTLRIGTGVSLFG